MLKSIFDQLKNNSQFVSAYLTARRRHPQGAIEVVCVRDVNGNFKCYGSPSEWPIGTAARVLRRELKVEVYRSEEDKDRLPDVELIEEAKEETKVKKEEQPPLPHPGRLLDNEDLIEAHLKKFAKNLTIGVSSVQGNRSHMEDEYIIIRDFGAFLGGREATEVGTQSFYAVYDGHSGMEAAQFCRKEFPLHIAKLLKKNDSMDLCEAMKQGCIATDESFLTKARSENLGSGTVLTAIVVNGKQLNIANAGDCRIVISRAGKAIDLTRDHTPQLYDEKVRVESEGGMIEYGLVGGELEVTRSLGDMNPDTKEKLKGLTAEPEVDKMFVTDDDEFLILATDGLWKPFKSSQVAISFARKSLQNDNDVQKACKDLVDEALKRDSGESDNITVIMIGFNKIGSDGVPYVVPSSGQDHQWRPRDPETRIPRTKRIRPEAVHNLMRTLREAEGPRERLHSRSESQSSSPSPSSSPRLRPPLRSDPLYRHSRSFSTSTLSLASSSRSSSLDDLTRDRSSSTPSPASTSPSRSDSPLPLLIPRSSQVSRSRSASEIPISQLR